MKTDFRLSRASRRGDLGDASVASDVRPLVPRDTRVALVASAAA